MCGCPWVCEPQTGSSSSAPTRGVGTGPHTSTHRSCCSEQVHGILRLFIGDSEMELGSTFEEGGRWAHGNNSDHDKVMTMGHEQCPPCRDPGRGRPPRSCPADAGPAVFPGLGLDWARSCLTPKGYPVGPLQSCPLPYGQALGCGGMGCWHGQQITPNVPIGTSRDPHSVGC